MGTANEAKRQLKHFVDLLLQIRAGAYLFEAANPRHEHEWQVWRQVKLPDDKILIPGVVSHCIHLVEHPELVAQRLACVAIGTYFNSRIAASLGLAFLVFNVLSAVVSLPRWRSGSCYGCRSVSALLPA